MNITLSVVTRKRVEGLKRLIKSIENTALFLDKLKYVFICDEDDIESLDFINKIKDKRMTLKVSQPVSEIHFYTNNYLDLVNTEIITSACDDNVFETKGWDVIVREAFLRFEDRICLVFGNDGVQGGRVATQGFYHINWIKKLGYLVPPYFNNYVGDRYLTTLADKLNRKVYLENVKIAHLHLKSGEDETYKRALARSKSPNCFVQRNYGLEMSDGEAFQFLITKGIMESDLNKLREGMR